MAARDSDEDIRKYLPDLSTILRDADPERAKEKLAKAQNNPELDAAMAQAHRPSAPPSGASPWAAEPVVIAAAALPSSLAAPPVVVVKKLEAKRGKRAPLSQRAKAIVAVMAVAVPVALLWVLLVRPSGRERVEPARTGASAATAPMMSATTPTPASAPIVAPPAALSAESDAGASVAPIGPFGPAPTKSKAHPGAREDPYDAAPPGPTKTVESVVLPPPTVAPTASIAPVVSSAPVAPPPSATATVKPIF